MKNVNPYAILRVDCLRDSMPVEAQYSWLITSCPDERITLYTSKTDDDLWLYGYEVWWARQRLSTQKPSAALGMFRSQREAQLYAIGFLGVYLDYFIEETRNAIRNAEAKLQQASLF